MNIDVFTRIADTATIATPSATSSSASLNRPSGLFGSAIVRIVNGTNSLLFIEFGDSAVTAATTSNPIVSGATEVFAVNQSNTHFAARTASGSATGNVYGTLGQGA